MKKTHFLSLLFCLPLLMASNCRDRIKADLNMSAMAAGDLTAMVEGCGNQLVSGYTFCRKMEGDASLDEVYLVAPPAKCEGDKPCVEWKVYFPDGETASMGGQFPKDTTRVAVKWKDLLKRDTFQLGDGGFWGLRYIISWIDQDGYAKKTVVDGEIRLVVHRKGYNALNAIQEDPNYVWAWSENGVTARMSTAGRAYVGVKP